jgi:hypothetical protein
LPETKGKTLEEIEQELVVFGERTQSHSNH